MDRGTNKQTYMVTLTSLLHFLGEEQVLDIFYEIQVMELLGDEFHWLSNMWKWIRLALPLR